VTAHLHAAPAAASDMFEIQCFAGSCRPMIAKTLFLAKDLHRIGAQSLPGKQIFRDHGPAQRLTGIS
jgi:hypothetical protein